MDGNPIPIEVYRGSTYNIISYICNSKDYVPDNSLPNLGSKDEPTDMSIAEGTGNLTQPHDLAYLDRTRPKTFWDRSSIAITDYENSTKLSKVELVAINLSVTYSHWWIRY